MVIEWYGYLKQNKEPAMIKKIQWQTKYKIGIKEVDLQHEYFALLINRLDSEMTLTNSIQYKHRLMEELSLYASFHFISEENMMIKANFPDYKGHARLHRKLLSRLNDQINYFRSGKTTKESIINFLVSWFFEHTLEQDKAFSLFLNEK